jgi:hypothetical protein
MHFKYSHQTQTGVGVCILEAMNFHRWLLTFQTFASIFRVETIYQTTRRHISNDSHFYSYCHENLRYHISRIYLA